MDLLHGPLSDSFGRRTVLLSGTFLFVLASLGCALSESVGSLCGFRTVQGICADAGTVVVKAILRDRLSDAQARKAMAGMMMFFAAAPAVAPIIGSAVLAAWGWRAVFWFLAGLALTLCALTFVLLRETHPPNKRQEFRLRSLMSGYRRIAENQRFLLLSCAVAFSYDAVFLYILASPTFMGKFLDLGPRHYFWLFVVSIAGIALGAKYSTHLSTRMKARTQLKRGFTIMFISGALNVAASVGVPPSPYWTLPIIGALALGWALLVPVVTVELLDMVRDARGMVSSMQPFLTCLTNVVVSAAVVPLAISSIGAMACASSALLIVGWRLGGLPIVYRRPRFLQLASG